MKPKRDPSRPLPSEITPLEAWLSRRELIAGLAAAGAVAALPRPASADPTNLSALKYQRNAALSLKEPPNSFEDITTYNNFYEFGTSKSDPAERSGKFQPRPWTVNVTGECARPGRYDLDDLLRPHALEERVYRMRCVEAWSMVIPWVGVPLAAVLKRLEPNSRAKYVAFETVLRPSQMPGQRFPVLDWPYVEGLRIDEAMHPLTILAVGVHGRALPNQNGAPLRLVVPWKYGFKGIKSIVAIRFTEREPPTSWNRSAPHEYGFYANVNPNVDHPRWSQAQERRIGAGLFAPKQPTLPFNGYAAQVASLYAGMDLRKHF